MFILKKKKPGCVLRVQFSVLYVTWGAAPSPFNLLYLCSVSLSTRLKIMALAPRLAVTPAGCPLLEDLPERGLWTHGDLGSNPGSSCS